MRVSASRYLPAWPRSETAARGHAPGCRRVDRLPPRSRPAPGPSPRLVARPRCAPRTSILPRTRTAWDRPDSRCGRPGSDPVRVRPPVVFTGDDMPFRRNDPERAVHREGLDDGSHRVLVAQDLAVEIPAPVLTVCPVRRSLGVHLAHQVRPAVDSDPGLLQEGRDVAAAIGHAGDDRVRPVSLDHIDETIVRASSRAGRKARPMRADGWKFPATAPHSRRER